MVTSTGDLRGRTIEARDGEIGKVSDVLFDDARWSVRYVAVDTGTWLPGRRVLLTPDAVEEVGDRLRVGLTVEQVEQSPPLSSDEPVSRRWETDLHEFYGYAPYWTQPLVWGNPDVGAVPPVPPPLLGEPGDAPGDAPADPHLRSAAEVTGYHVRAADDEVGHVEDVLVDDATWMIPSLVVDTRNILPGRKVLLAVTEVRDIGWEDRLVRADVARDDLEGRSEYRPGG